MAKIIRLAAENIKKLKAVEIVPVGNVVKITGPNGAGKSSVLDSIVMAFEGGKKLPKRPIRDGETEGNIVVETEEFTITRTFTEKGSYLEVRNKEGAKVASPQALLDKMLGQISFDPLEFFDDRRYDAKARKKLLLDMLGLDFSRTDEQIAALYDKRTEVNREVLRSKAAWAEITVPEDTPDTEVSISTLQYELDAANTVNAEAAAEEESRKTKRSDLKGYAQRVKSAKEEVERIQEMLDNAEDNLKTVLSAQAKLQKMVDAFEPISTEDTGPIIEQMKKIGETNALVVKKNDKHNYAEIAKKYDKQSDEISKQMKALEDNKTTALSKAKMPIAGLTIGADGLAYNNIPVEQISASEQLRVGVAMGMALNPTLKVLRIIDGSLLDKNSMKIIADMVGAEGYQCWVECVDDTGKVGIYIEDGSVKKVNK
jgi:DNA repair exonuclease SbcCD ATPase subunit